MFDRSLPRLFLAILILAPVSAKAACIPCGPCTEVFNVVDYCADGTDTSSDTPTFQDALNCANACITSTNPSHGATVEVPAGIFYVDDLVIGSNVTLRGAGIGTTILRANSSPTDILTNDDHTNGNSYIEITGITFDGDTDKVSTGADNGLRLNNVADFVVSQCEFKNSLESGLVIEAGSIRGLVEGSYAHTNEVHGFSARGVLDTGASTLTVVEQIRFVGNKSDDNGENGFDVYQAKDMSFSGCSARGNDETGFSADSTRGATYSGCIAKDSGEHGFKFFTETPVTAQSLEGETWDITVSSSIAQDNTNSGFVFQAPKPETGQRSAARFALSGSHARGNGDFGVYVARVWQQMTSGATPNVRQFSIQGGTFTENSRGIFLRNVSYGTISGAVIMNNDGRATSGSRDYRGIFINSPDSNIPSEHITITGNVIGDDQATATQDYAIKSSGSSDYILVTGNIITGHTTPLSNEPDPINLTGSNNKVAHNIGVSDHDS